jgi:hypothetical protein
MLQEYEAKIAALDRMVGGQALEIEFLKGTLESAQRLRSASTSVIAGPVASQSPKDALMGLSRSTYYDRPSSPADDGAIVAAMIEICDEFESYGYRRVGAELRPIGTFTGDSFRPTSERKHRMK